MFENFCDQSMRVYDLDPAHFYTIPGYAWDVMLKYTGIKLKLLREEGTDFWPKNRFFFIVLNYFLALSLPKNLFTMSKFS